MAETKNIYAALADFQKEIKPIPLTKEVTVKTSSGSSYKFKYAPLVTIIETIQPVMDKNGLSFSQTIAAKEITTTIYHKTGEFIASTIPFPMPEGLDAQKVGSWITYLRRYGLVTAFGLIAEEDDDANIAGNNQFSASNLQSPKKSPFMGNTTGEGHLKANGTTTSVQQAPGQTTPLLCPNCSSPDVKHVSGTSVKGFAWEGVKCKCTKGVVFFKDKKKPKTPKITQEAEDLDVPPPPDFGDGERTGDEIL